MVYKSGQIFLPFCHNTRVWQTDGRTDGQTDGQTEFSPQYRVCITCSAVKTQAAQTRQTGMSIGQKDWCVRASREQHISQCWKLPNWRLWEQWVGFCRLLTITFNSFWMTADSNCTLHLHFTELYYFFNFSFFSKLESLNCTTTMVPILVTFEPATMLEKRVLLLAVSDRVCLSVRLFA